MGRVDFLVNEIVEADKLNQLSALSANLKMKSIISKSNILCMLLIIASHFSCWNSINDHHAPVGEIRNRIVHEINIKDFSMAIASCDTLIVIDSLDSWALEKKAMALFYLERFGESIEVANLAIAINARSVDAYLARGNAKKYEGDSLGAIEDYSYAIQLDSGSVVALNNRGALYYSMGLRDSALVDFRKLVSMDSSYPTGLSNLATYYTDEGITDSAIFYYNRAIALGGRESLFYGRGILYFKSDQYELAVADFTQALRYNSTNPLTYLHRGYAYAVLGKKTQMCDDFTRSMELGNQEARDCYELRCRQ